MRIWPRDFWWNPHLFCSLSTSTFGTAWRAPAHATLERKAATSCFQRSMPPSWISNAWHPIHMSNPVSNAKGKKSWPSGRITSGFMLKPAMIHKQDVYYSLTLKDCFPFCCCWCGAVLPVLGHLLTAAAEWHLRASVLGSEIPSFGTSEVWSVCVWSPTQMLARRNSLSLLIISSSHLLSTVTSGQIDVAHD